MFIYFQQNYAVILRLWVGWQGAFDLYWLLLPVFLHNVESSIQVPSTTNKNWKRNCILHSSGILNEKVYLAFLWYFVSEIVSYICWVWKNHSRDAYTFIWYVLFRQNLKLLTHIWHKIFCYEVVLYVKLTFSVRYCLVKVTNLIYISSTFMSPFKWCFVRENVLKCWFLCSFDL